MRKRGRAKQPSAKSLGLLPWQRDIWLLMLDHAMDQKLGPPDLSTLEGFSSPAITQYSVTTPELLRCFQKYNSGKPYHRQIRPFGFMVMFQQADEADPSTAMRVIAPFNRNPAKAAQKAFDRDTGVTVRPKQLKTYVASLRTYYNHPEAKFLNGERGDRGPTLRRHIIARSIMHIGKEANRLDIQMVSGVEPEAQVEFHVSLVGSQRMKTIAVAVRRFGPSRIARAAGLSRKHISAVLSGRTAATEQALSLIERAISRLDITEAGRSTEMELVRTHLQAESERIGLRRLANDLNVSPSFLSRVVSRQRKISAAWLRRIN